MKINIAIHNHQAVGNFQEIFENAYNKAYKPFLDILEKHENIKINFHFTGHLLDWLLTNRIDFINRLGRLIKKGQVELIGGAYYEPILSNLRESDILGQIELTKIKLKKIFDIVPKGVWIPEFVWEQSLIKKITTSKAEYTVLPEEHFVQAGIKEKDINGYYLTERCANSLAIFSGLSFLKETIPNISVSKVLSYLKDLNDKGIELVSYLGEGESFGLALNSYKEVIENAWLDDFFTAIEQSDFLETSLFSKTMYEFLPKDLVYIPSFSTVLKGGFWENFLRKYVESNLLHKRLMHVSARLDKFKDMIERRTVTRIRAYLYKAQSNTAYWHGTDGGIYVPYLRSALFQNLIKAESLLEVQLSKFGDPYGIRIEDFDGDRNDELIYSSMNYAVFVGLQYGTIIELDNRAVGINVANVLRRQKEAEHDNYDKIQVYDKYPRDIGLLHIVPQDTSLEELKTQSYTELFEYKKFKIIARSKRYVILETKGYLNISGQKIPIVVQKKYRFLKKGVELLISAFLEEEISISVTMVLESNFNLMMKTWGKDLRQKTNDFSIFNEYFSYGIKYSVKTSDKDNEVKLIGYEVNTLGVGQNGLEKTYQGTSLNYMVPINLRPDKTTELTLGIYFI